MVLSAKANEPLAYLFHSPRVTNDLAFEESICLTRDCMAKMLAAPVLGNSRPLQPPHASVERDI